MEFESTQNNITTIDPSRRIVKYFTKCLIELLKHAESVQYKNNKLVNYDVSTTVNYDTDNELNITEHNIKVIIKKEGPIFKEIDKIKKSIVELLTICSQQNILIDYDTNRPHIPTYDAFDDAQRILVMNHLTLHILSIVETIYLSVKFFKSSEYLANGQQIKKSFSNIYKEIKTLPMRPDIIENMDASFKALIHKSEYKDSYNYLVDKLNVLCKYIYKFNKSYIKKCGFNDSLTMQDSTDDDNSPRKKMKNTNFIKSEMNHINLHQEPESVFKIPETIHENTENVTNKHIDEMRKKKKRKIHTDIQNDEENNCKNTAEKDTLLSDVSKNNSNKKPENANKNENMENFTNKHTDKRKKRKRHTDIENHEGNNCKNTAEKGTLLSDISKNNKNSDVNGPKECTDATLNIISNKKPENINENENMENFTNKHTDKKKKRKRYTDIENNVNEPTECTDATLKSNSTKKPENDDIHENMEKVINKHSDKTKEKKKRKIHTDVENDESNNCKNTVEKDTIISDINKNNVHSDVTKPKENTVTNKHTDEMRKKKKHKIHTGIEKNNGNYCENIVENDVSKYDQSDVINEPNPTLKNNSIKNNCDNLQERELLINELLNDSIRKNHINSDTEKKAKKHKKKKSKIHSEHKTKNNSNNNLDKELYALINNSNMANNNKNQRVTADSENDKTENIKKKKSTKSLDCSTQKDESTKANQNQVDKNCGKAKNEEFKKRKIDTNDNVSNEENISKQINKKHQLINDSINMKSNINSNLNNSEMENNINQEEEHNEMTVEELDLLSNHFLSKMSKGSNESNKSKVNNDNNIIHSDILSAIGNGDIEIDYNNEEVEEFTKIIKENSLNTNERFLYIQDLLESAHDKIALTEEAKEKIKNLHILVDWEICPAHLVCTNLATGPNEEEKVILAKLGVTSGHFSAKEDEIIRNNWKKFCKQHDLEEDPIPFLFLVVNKERLLSSTERRKFFQYIAQGLPHKALHSIFRRFKCLFKPKTKIGRFSPEEDELILTYLDHIKRDDNKHKFARLAPLINRDRFQIERRYRALKEAAKQPPKKISWTIDLKEKFLKHLIEETRSESVEELREKHINSDTYNIIGRIMDISPAKLKIHWIFRLYTELFASEPLSTDFIKMKLIEKFHELKCDDWKTIDWSQMTAMFDGITKCYLWITLKNVINEFELKQKNLKDSIDHLYVNYLPILEQRILQGKDRILPRLRFENGTLIKYKI